MKYYYLDGLNKNGAFSVEEIKEKNLSHETLILREDKTEWLPLSQFSELMNQVEINSISDKPFYERNNFNPYKQMIKRKYLIVIGLIMILATSFFAYQKFSLTENDAREISNRFFNLMMTKDNYKSQNEVYPSLQQNFARILFKNICKINNISKNEDGDYEVYATYNFTNTKSYPIYLIIGRVDGVNIIKESRGISYAYYDKVLEYGKKTGYLTGQEYDVEMETIINERLLRKNLLLASNIKFMQIKQQIKTKDNLKVEFGHIMGNVTIINNSNFSFGYYDLSCKVDFYDKNGDIISSDDVLSINGVDAYSSVTGSVLTPNMNASSYKIIPLYNGGEDFTNRVRELVINDTKSGILLIK